ncbi:hypothetical protein GQ457_08G016060 [Hibiscus cannabinus]
MKKADEREPKVPDGHITLTLKTPFFVMMRGEIAMVTTLYHRSHWHLCISTSLANTNRTPHTFTNEANFNINMFIILVALLYASICAIGLNFIMRCGRRFGLDCWKILYHMDTSEETADCLATAKGLEKSALRKILVAVYSPRVNVKVPRSSCPTYRRSLLDQATSSDAAVVTEGGIRQHENPSVGEQTMIMNSEEQTI